MAARLSARNGVEVVPIGKQDDLKSAVSDATYVVNCTSLKLNPVIYEAISGNLQRLVMVGSTRSLTAFDDPHADWLREAQADFAKSGLPGVMLLPSLVYGGDDQRYAPRPLSDKGSRRSVAERRPVVDSAGTL